MANCNPPRNTPRNTLCVLRRSVEGAPDELLLAVWLGEGWFIPALKKHVRDTGLPIYMPGVLGGLDWRYSGVCPELPDETPMTASELAQDALDNCLSEGLATAEWRANYYANALRRIAEIAP